MQEYDFIVIERGEVAAAKIGAYFYQLKEDTRRSTPSDNIFNQRDKKYYRVVNRIPYRVNVKITEVFKLLTNKI